MKTISDWVDTNRDRITRLSDAIWSYAELGMQEFRSSKALKEFLKAEGFKVKSGVAGMPTAFVATWGAKKPAIGYIAEYDALPMVSNKTVSVKDPVIEGAPGHGCGHNLVGTGGTAAAVALKNIMEKEGIQGRVIVFGTPAEETFVGKAYMHRAGIFKLADVIIMWHPNTKNKVRTGSNLALVTAKFGFKGRTAHGARPQTGRSALDAIELMNVGVNFMREHIPMESRIHYVITHGGIQPNVVPDFAESWYYIRHPDIREVIRIYDWVIDCARGAALMTQTTMSYETRSYHYNLLLNIAGSRLLYKNLELFGIPEFTSEEIGFAKKIQREVNAKEVGINTTIEPFFEKEEVFFSSNDMGDASWSTPLVHLSMATRIEGVPGHTWADVAISGMSIGHKMLINAIKIMASTGLEFMTQPGEMKKIRAEFEEKTKNFKEPESFADIPKPPVDQYKGEAAHWHKLLKGFYKNS